jgi:hypothetical protein
LSSNSSCKASLDTNETVGEKDNYVDGDKELLRDEPSSTTTRTNETTVSHLNKSRQNIVVDGKLYRCNKVRLVGEKNKVVYIKYSQ